MLTLREEFAALQILDFRIYFILFHPPTPSETLLWVTGTDSTLCHSFLVTLYFTLTLPQNTVCVSYSQIVHCP